jgi:hypothetical protein
MGVRYRLSTAGNPMSDVYLVERTGPHINLVGDRLRLQLVNYQRKVEDDDEKKDGLIELLLHDGLTVVPLRAPEY